MLSFMSIGMKIVDSSVYLVDVELMSRLIEVLSKMMLMIVIWVGRLRLCRKLVFLIVMSRLMLDWVKVVMNCVVKNVMMM